MKQKNWLLLIIGLVLSLTVEAQFYNAKGYRVKPRTLAKDSTGIPGIGEIQYDAPDSKFRFWDGSAWFTYSRLRGTPGNDNEFVYWSSGALVSSIDFAFSSSKFIIGGVAGSNRVEVEQNGLFSLRSSGWGITTQGPFTLTAPDDIRLVTNSLQRFEINDDGALGIGADASEDFGTTGQIFTSNGSSAPPSWEDIPELDSDNWSPTFTGVTNVASHTNPLSPQYIRAGDHVSVVGGVSVTPTAGSTITEIRVNLPFASNFTSTVHAIGTAVAEVSGVQFVSGTVLADATNDEAVIRFFSNGTGIHVFRFYFMYKIL